MIPVSRPLLLKKSKQRLIKAIDKASIAQGSEISEFENNIAEFLNKKFAVTTTSGTTALYLALKCLNLAKGSRILIPNFLIVSILNVVLENSFKPVFCKTNNENWCIDINDFKSKLKKNIKVAIVAQVYSSSPDMIEIKRLCKKNKVILIEDSAEGFGGEYSNNKFGSFGDISCISLYANKIVTTGEGGVVFTNNEKYHKELITLRNLYFGKNRDFRHAKNSLNSRFTSIQASIGIDQISKINFFLNKRKIIYEHYLKFFNNYKTYFSTQLINKNIKSAYWVFGILIKKNFISRKNFESKLFNKGIQTRRFFYPLSMQPFLNKKMIINDKTALEIWRNGIYLPLGNGIRINEVSYVLKIIKEIIKDYDKRKNKKK